MGRTSWRIFWLGSYWISSPVFSNVSTMGDELEHADPLPLFSDLLKEKYLWSEEHDEEKDEIRYEKDEVFPDDLFYSFYYYSWQAVLAYRSMLEQEVPRDFVPKISNVLAGL